MRVSSSTHGVVPATLEMSQPASQGGEPVNVGDGDYESLPPHVSVTTHMTAGAVAGVLEHTVMYPVDSVKTRMQSLQPDPNAQYRGVYEALKRIIRTEGFFRPLRGLNITMMGAGPAHALYFACYERVKRSLSDTIQNGGNSHLANGIAGSVATVLHDAIMNPAEGRPLHHLRDHAGVAEPPQTLPPRQPHRVGGGGGRHLRRRHHAAGRLQDAAQHAGERGAQLGERQRPPERHGKRLQGGVQAGRAGGFLQRGAGPGHLPDALHRHRLVRVRVLQVLHDKAGLASFKGRANLRGSNKKVTFLRVVKSGGVSFKSK
ncbi:mitoferrin-1 isoform X2 [Nerophis lumbriciformis]|uniref:mitoferrin-1 isoform X2 n=1 Tax=Nerophis lumbriciformis TaxID=546530 RepID=UPI003BAAAEDF